MYVCMNEYDDDEGVEDGPAVGEKLAEPVGEHVDEQLDGEDCGEAQVKVVEHVLEAGRGAVLPVEDVVLALCFDDRRAEVLRRGAGN